MIIKKTDDRTNDIAKLKDLLNHPVATAQQKEKIKKEIRMISAGKKGEDGSAYQINFYFESSNNWAVIHDLRLEHNEQVAQIDHLIINRFLDMWVCESKHFSEGVAINDNGEFSTFYKGKQIGQPSPIEQNIRHIHVLKKMLNDNTIWQPQRLGFTIKPDLKNLIVISKNTRITRPPKTKFEWINEVIKADQIKSYIDREDPNPLLLARVISQEVLEFFAKELVLLHKPIQINWAGKFGLKSEIANAPIDEKNVEKKKLICESCNIAITYNVAKFCWTNEKRFNNKTLCMDCQKSINGAQ